MFPLRVHRYQWVICRSTVHNQDHIATMVPHMLGNGFVLYVDRQLPLEKIGLDTYFIGLHFLGQSLDQDPSHHFGRFVFLNDGTIETDATGSMSIFYAINDSLIVCGSSLPLIAELEGRRVSGRRHARAGSLGFQPLPVADLDGYERLYPGSRLDLSNGTVRHTIRKVNSSSSIEDAANKLVSALDEFCALLKPMERVVILALTAGLDSRTLFAALVRNKVRFKAFTAINDTVGSRIDCETAAELCDLYEVEHLIGRPKNSDDKDLAVFDRHNAGLDNTKTRETVNAGLFAMIPAGALILHGGAFEIGREKLEMLFSIDNGVDSLTDWSIKFSDMCDRDYTALKRWLDMRNDYKWPGVSVANQYYIDQKRAGWGGDNRHAEDCFNFDWVLPANSWTVLDAIMSLSGSTHHGGNIQQTAIEMILPGSTVAVPVNRSATKMERLRGLLYSKRSRAKLVLKIRKFSAGLKW